MQVALVSNESKQHEASKKQGWAMLAVVRMSTRVVYKYVCMSMSEQVRVYACLYT